MIKLLMVIGLLILIGCSPEMYSQPQIQYRFEPVKLPDGTSCHIVHGGTHSGMVGITCDYSKEDSNERI